jgi:hypothetical protein
VSIDEAKTIFSLVEILKTGRASLIADAKVIHANKKQVQVFLENFGAEKHVNLLQYEEGKKLTIFGNNISLGSVLIQGEHFIPENEYENLRARSDKMLDDEKLTIQLTSVDGKPPTASFFAWVEKEEFEHLWNIPIVKDGALKILLSLLYYASKEDAGIFEPKKFVDLIDDAKNQVSDDGRPLNHLSTCTTEELIAKADRFIPMLTKQERELLEKELRPKKVL